ncbi:MAG: hypothetical protein ACUVQ1_06780 [Candidatus Kapaibacteriales bacterium]
MKFKNIRNNKLLFCFSFFLFFLLYSKNLSYESLSFITSYNTSNPIGIESNWIGNPLNLSYINNAIQILIAVTPSKFSLPDLNTYSIALCKKEFLSINTSSTFHFIHSKIFSNYFINLALNKPFFENYNLAVQFSSETISVTGFKSKSNFYADIFFEYLLNELFRVGCRFQNLFSKDMHKKIGFGASYIISDDFFCGVDINIYLKQFTSYKFVSSIRLTEKYTSEIMFSTNPSLVNFSNELEISNILKLFFALEYNTKLGISQTIAIQLCF